MDRSIPDWIVEHGVCIAEIRLKAIIIDQTGERGIYMDERLKKQLDFILEADKVKNIMRQTYLADGKRKENDAEHSWHLALMAVLLKEYAPEEVDLSKVIPMLMTLLGELPSIQEKKLLHSAFTAFFQKTRENGFMIFGKSSKLMKHQRPNMRTCWTTVSHFF